MKKVIKIVAVIFTMLIITVSAGITFTGCTEAERVNHNLNKQANYFDCERMRLIQSLQNLWSYPQRHSRMP